MPRIVIVPKDLTMQFICKIKLQNGDEITPNGSITWDTNGYSGFTLVDGVDYNCWATATGAMGLSCPLFARVNHTHNNVERGYITEIEMIIGRGEDPPGEPTPEATDPVSAIINDYVP